MEISCTLHSLQRLCGCRFFQPSASPLFLLPSSSQLSLPKSDCRPRVPLISHPQRSPSNKHCFQVRNRPLTGTSCLPDNGASRELATEAIRADTSLVLKRKATEVANDLKGTSIFLVGINNAMKTKVGKVIADTLRYYYFDSDALIEEAASTESSGKSFRQIDENGFRESETEVLKQLSSMGRLVVSAGNGAVQSSTNLALLRHGISIWIDIPLHMIAKEFIEQGDSSAASKMSIPESSSEILTELAMLYEEHSGGYATADAIVSLQNLASKLGCEELDEVTAEDMALEVLKEMEKLTRVKKMMEEAGKPF